MNQTITPETVATHTVAILRAIRHITQQRPDAERVLIDLANIAGALAGRIDNANE